MATTFKEKRNKFDGRIKEVEQISSAYVLIGFQAGEKTRSQVKGKRRKEAGKSMAQIAAENEFGTEKIPARPFMTTSFDQNKDKINKIIISEYGKIIDGESTVKRSLNLLGLFGVDLVQKKIREIQSPPNSPRTIAIKKSSKPLIDFGQMIQSVRHKVVIS
jgi:HK97 gp10 family phage protein